MQVKKLKWVKDDFFYNSENLGVHYSIYKPDTKWEWAVGLIQDLEYGCLCYDNPPEKTLRDAKLAAQSHFDNLIITSIDQAQ